jgi:hypothetical protein
MPKPPEPPRYECCPKCGSFPIYRKAYILDPIRRGHEVAGYYVVCSKYNCMGDIFQELIFQDIIDAYENWNENVIDYTREKLLKPQLIDFLPNEY